MLLDILTRWPLEAFAWPDGADNTDAPTDGSQKTESASQQTPAADTTNAQTDGAQTSGAKVEFSPEQQAKIQEIIDRTLAKGIQRGQQQLLQELNLTPDDLPALKEALAAVDADDDEGDDEPEPPTQRTSRRNSKASPEEEWQQRLEQLQRQAESRIEALQQQLQRQQEIAAGEKINSALSTALSRFQLAETVDPGEIRALLRESIRVDDQMNLYIVDEEGNPRLNMNGENLGVDEYVASWLNQRKHYLARGRGGAGSSSVTGASPPNPLQLAMANYQPGAVRDALANNEELRQQLRDLLTPASDVNPFAKAQQDELKRSS